MSYKSDKLDNGLYVTSYYFSSVNKYSHTLSKSVLVLSDTVFFSSYNEPNSITYTLIPGTGKFNFFTLTDVDSSLYGTSLIRKYPRTISFMQVDTGLNITVANKPVLHSGKLSKDVITGMGFSQNAADTKTILLYHVLDTTNAKLNANWYAGKLLLVNDTGKVLADEFLGPEPQGAGAVFTVSITERVYRNYNNTYATMVVFTDSSFYDYTLLILDSNLHPVSASGYPRSNYGFGGYNDEFFFLPTGSLIRSAMGRYVDTVVRYFNEVGKGGPATGYVPDQLYAPPPLDTNDYYHSVYPRGLIIDFIGTEILIGNPTIYNRFDNRIYTFSATKSNEYYGYCMDGTPNLGQIAAIDTNLAEKWVKYIRPRPGYCIKSSSVAATDGRNGVLVSGWESNLSDLNNYNSWLPFIYYVDSNTSLGINNPESPVIITDQFTLYPNPATEQLFIENVLGTSFKYTVVNAIGQVLATGNGQGIKTGIGVQHFAPGIYMIAIETREKKRFNLRFSRE